MMSETERTGKAMSYKAGVQCQCNTCHWQYLGNDTFREFPSLGDALWFVKAYLKWPNNPGHPKRGVIISPIRGMIVLSTEGHHDNA